ncbi:MAG TPA: ABC transporter permease, partial [Rectinemataceae bacterium]|nr:ABC transporter permease [Rectinemataceae bacterium]
MNTLGIAFRNLGRNRRRSFLAILSVFMSMMIVIFADGFISGVLDSIVRNATKNQTGHVNIATEDYRRRERFMPTNAAIGDADAVVAAIEARPELKGLVAQVAPRVRFGVVLSSGTATKAAIGIAGESERERSLLMLDRSVLPGGSYLGAPGTAIVGSRLAADLGLKVGDSLKVVAQKADYGLGFKKFRIAGLFRTGMELFDDSAFQVGIDDARELLGLGRGAS